MLGENIYMDRKMSNQMTQNPEGGKVNAAIVVLARNNDIDGVLLSLDRMERKFNHKYLYDYVFLNNGDFSYDFRDRSDIFSNQTGGWYPMYGYLKLTYNRSYPILWNYHEVESFYLPTIPLDA